MKAGRRRRELVAGKTSPRFHAAAPHREGKHMASRWLDRLLIVLFLFTSFMSLVYAPLFVFGCGWHGLTLGPDGPCGDSWVGRAWLGYVQMEPIYHDAPVWLQLVNELDMFFFRSGERRVGKEGVR